MEKEQYATMYNIEEDSWWYKGMRKILFSLLDKYLKRKKDLKILDVGCGTGINLSYLKKYGNVTGIDISDDAIKFSKKRGHSVRKADVEKLPFKNNTFDLVTSLEVIYHKQVKDDIKALKEMERVLKKRGLAIIRVPAFKILRGEHDMAVHGKRRYTKKELKFKVKKTGLKVKKISYLNAFIFPIMLLHRTIKKQGKKKVKSDLELTPKFLNEILTKTLYLESRIIKHTNLPFGVSLICIAEKQ